MQEDFSPLSDTRAMKQIHRQRNVLRQGQHDRLILELPFHRSLAPSRSKREWIYSHAQCYKTDNQRRYLKMAQVFVVTSQALRVGRIVDLVVRNFQALQ